MKFAKSALETRFGLRILVVFTASAIIPMLVLAALAYTSTRNQLEEDALVSLRREVKSATMSIAEQINLGAAQLSLAATSSEWREEGVADAFSRIDLLDSSILDLTPSQRHHLQSGEFLLLMPGASENEIRLIRTVGSQILIGFFEESFLYKPERLGDGVRYWVADSKGRYLFGASSDGLTRDVTSSSVGDSETRTPFELESAAGVEVALVWPLFLKHPYLSSELHVGMSRNKQSIHGPLKEFRTDFIASFLLALLGSVSIALYQIRVRVKPLDEIVNATHQIERGDFSYRASISSRDEFELLGSSINEMAEKLGEDFKTLETLRTVSETLLEAMNWEAVAKQVVPAAIEFSGASGGSLFVVDRASDAGSRPLLEVVQADSRGSGREDERPASLEFTRRALNGAELQYALRADEEGAKVCRVLDPIVGSRVEAVLAIPLISGSGERQGVVRLVFDEALEGGTMSAGATRSLSILAGQAGAALKNIGWREDLRGLFEGIIRLTANAIDEKSPYTGDHCRRVPVLTEMIADAVCQNEIGPLKNFTLDENERYELKIAALLHDCGKVATPVHVMDKATKLETIHDRIELIRMRAEIIRRDLELTGLREQPEGKGDARLDDRLHSIAVSKLMGDLAFLESCNIGGEFMDDAKQERVRKIAAQYRWVDESGNDHSLISDDESMNLQISRGTLNDEEREIINGHVVTTIRLLEELPFPEEMRNVPEIAGAHHECVDGTGYPQGLEAEQLNIQSRILGLADVFEALTAKTRPYKPGMPLSQTLEILKELVEKGKLDSDLFEIFIREKVYLEYAADHISGEQIDEAYEADLEMMTAAWESSKPLRDRPSA